MTRLHTLSLFSRPALAAALAAACLLTTAPGLARADGAAGHGHEATEQGAVSYTHLTLPTNREV